MTNFRHHQRLSYLEGVQYQVNPLLSTEVDLQEAGFSPNSTGDLAGADISSGGLRLKIEDFIAPGTVLNLTVPLFDAEQIVLIGKIAWVQKYPHADFYCAGVEFLDLPENVRPRSILETYIKKKTLVRS